MKILVLGAAGMAGHMIAIYLQEQGYFVRGYARKKLPFCDVLLGDARDTEYLTEILRAGEFDAVVNCVGLLNQFAESNHADAVFLNSYLPHFLAQVLRNTRTKYIHLSTDCVFSGKSGGYKEDSSYDGESFYDRSKALGEVKDNRNLTFRNSIIGPDIKNQGIGLFNWFMHQQAEINGYTKAMWTGVTTLTLAKAIEAAIQEDLCGLYQLVNNTSISKYDLCRLFNTYFKEGKLIIHPSEKVVADKSLINTRHDFSFAVPSYEQMVAEMKIWVDQHKELYPHYFN